MRLRNVPGARETIIESYFSIQEPKTYRGKWEEEFGNKNPIHIEVGMGKGRFILEMAERNPEINYIGIEKYSSVLVRAVEKTEEFEGKNLRLIRMDAEEIEEVFAPGEVGRIYLNFSDPWPKDRHAKRRLTSTRFLERYHHILAPEGRVIFKTDNRDLENCTYDLHNSEFNEGNVMTEYEEKFSAKGNPICRLTAFRHDL